MLSTVEKIVLLSVFALNLIGCASAKVRGPASIDIESTAARFKNLCEGYPLPENDPIYSQLGTQSREFEIILKDGKPSDLVCNFANLGVQPMMRLFRSAEIKEICPNAKLRNRDGYPENKNLGPTQSDYGPGAGTLFCCIGCSALDWTITLVFLFKFLMRAVQDGAGYRPR
jgi:hypothetical protein